MISLDRLNREEYIPEEDTQLFRDLIDEIKKENDSLISSVDYYHECLSTLRDSLVHPDLECIKMSSDGQGGLYRDEIVLMNEFFDDMQDFVNEVDTSTHIHHEPQIDKITELIEEYKKKVGVV